MIFNIFLKPLIHFLIFNTVVSPKWHRVININSLHIHKEKICALMEIYGKHGKRVVCSRMQWPNKERVS